MLSTWWVAPSKGATVNRLRRLLGLLPLYGNSGKRRTALAVAREAKQLTGYDVRRAVTALDRRGAL